MGVPATGEPVRVRTSGRLVEVLVRVALVVGGLVSLRFGQDRLRAWSLEGHATFHWGMSGWFLSVGLVVLTGLAFGLAGWMPWGRMRFRLSRVLLLGVVPLVMLAHFWFLWGIAMQHNWQHPTFLLKLYFWDEEGPMFALAALIGIAIASGFVAKGSEAASAG